MTRPACSSATARTGRREFSRAYWIYVSGRLDAAEAATERVLARRPRHFDAICLLAQISSAKGQRQRAQLLMRRAIGLAPRWASAQWGLGRALVEQDLLKEAIAAYRRALAIGPATAEIESDLARALMRTGHLGEATTRLCRARARGRTRPRYITGSATRAQNKATSQRLSIATAGPSASSRPTPPRIGTSPFT